jgi:hypothetical protein
LASFDPSCWIGAWLTRDADRLGLHESLGGAPAQLPSATDDSRQGLSVVLPIDGKGIQMFAAS